MKRLSRSQRQFPSVNGEGQAFQADSPRYVMREVLWIDASRGGPHKKPLSLEATLEALLVPSGAYR